MCFNFFFLFFASVPAVEIDRQQVHLDGGDSGSLVQLLCAGYEEKVLSVLPGADVPVECLDGDFITTTAKPPGGGAFQLNQWPPMAFILLQLAVALFCFH